MTARVDAEQRRRMIEEAAYFRAARRDFRGGDPLADWVDAEAEVDARLQQSEQSAFLERLEERLATAGAKLTSLRRKADAMQADARAEWRDDLERLARLKDTLEKRLDEIREEGQHASHKVKEQAEKTWEEISDLIGRLGSRRRKERVD